jgi:hypothetical protein
VRRTVGVTEAGRGLNDGVRSKGGFSVECTSGATAAGRGLDPGVGFKSSCSAA